MITVYHVLSINGVVVNTLYEQFCKNNDTKSCLIVLLPNGYSNQCFSSKHQPNLINLHQTFQHVIHQSSCSGIQNMQLKYRHRLEVCDNCKHRLQGQNVQTENMELYKTVHYKQGGENRLLCSSVNSLKENKTLTSCKNHKVGNCGNLFKVCISDQKTNCMATVKSIIITINCPPSFGMQLISLKLCNIA